VGEERGREHGGGKKKPPTMERRPENSPSLAGFRVELATYLSARIPTGFAGVLLEGGVCSDPEPARHVLTTLRFEART